MITRIVKASILPQKQEEFRRIMREQIVPALTRQPGFVDHISIVSEKNPGESLSITFWQSRQDAENYGRGEYGRLINLVRPCLSGQADVSTYSVETSTVHRIAPEKAA